MQGKVGRDQYANKRREKGIKKPEEEKWGREEKKKDVKKTFIKTKVR